MKLLIGLGNPGRKYQSTRHNLGFQVLDELAKQAEFPPFAKQPRPASEICHGQTNDLDIWLLKPLTMMNLSGPAVGQIARSKGLQAGDIGVIYDEADLEFGKLRIRLGGGSGGHNGVQSIIDAIGPDFIRFRIGIDGPNRPEDTSDFVLSPFSKSEREQLPELVRAAAQAIQDYLARPDHQDHTIQLLG